MPTFPSADILKLSCKAIEVAVDGCVKNANPVLSASEPSCTPAIPATLALLAAVLEKLIPAVYSPSATVPLV